MTDHRTEDLLAEIERLQADREQLNKLTVEWNTMTKAARDEIERLRAALETISRIGAADHAREIARHALEPKSFKE